MPYNRIRAIGIVLAAFAITACGEKEPMYKSSSELYHNISKQTNSAYFSVPPGLVSVFLDETQKGNPEIIDILSDVKHLSFLIVSNDSSLVKEQAAYYEISARLDSISFKDLAQINNGKELVKIKVSSQDTIFNELVVLVANYDAVYCISFKGKIAPYKVIKLANPDNMAALSNLERFKR
ncbi:MAG: DUF4252 domain-containing protein [Bacteroidales bacterium]|nr:DUF4252 domain-containing protein [Bacteroidales bacterium]MBN2749157.1 DUF4252 domain-containing protein [Bacteroidales bacterium]